MKTSADVHIGGFVAPGFERVLDVFADNFTHRHELGGAVCVYRCGVKVVDLWGGIRNKGTGDAWSEETMVVVFSTTKGLSAMTMALAHSRGLLDFDERVATYWPEFAQNGKDAITVRQLLAHQAGLFALDEKIDAALLRDPDRLAALLARQKPAWKPGTRQGYHALTLGFYQSELLRRIDPQHRTLGRFFDDEIAAPLGLDLFIRLPESIPDERLATIVHPTPLEILRGFPLALALVAFTPRANIVRALRGSELAEDAAHVYPRNLEIPSGGAVGTARAIARAYDVFATGGADLGIRSETLAEIMKPAIAPTRGFYDVCMHTSDVRYNLGFMQHGAAWPFGSESSFGFPGAGGSLGFADPTLGIGYGYVTMKMGTSLTGDPREVALREAVYDVIRPTSRTAIERRPGRRTSLRQPRWFR